MVFWHCEVAAMYDYVLLATAAACWCYAGYCLIQLRYERQSPLLWWEPVPFSLAGLTEVGKEYRRRFFLAFVAGACAIMLAVALCSTR